MAFKENVNYQMQVGEMIGERLFFWVFGYIRVLMPLALVVGCVYYSFQNQALIAINLGFFIGLWIFLNQIYRELYTIRVGLNNDERGTEQTSKPK